MWICLLSLAMAAIPASQTPRSDLFNTAQHDDYSRGAFALQRIEVSLDGWRLMHRAQLRTDVMLALDLGDKSAKRLYLHHVWPNTGYACSAHNAVSTAIGTTFWAPLDAFVALAERRFADELTKMIRARNGHLKNAEAGQVLYGLAVMMHEVQDYKHRQQNGKLADGSTIRSSEHFLPYVHQLRSDEGFDANVAITAMWRSEAYLVALQQQLYRDAGPYLPAFWQSLASFHWDKGNALQFRPRTVDGDVNFTLDYMFPRWDLQPGGGAPPYR